MPTCYCDGGIKEEYTAQAKLSRLDWSCLYTHKAPLFTLCMSFIGRAPSVRKRQPNEKSTQLQPRVGHTWIILLSLFDKNIVHPPA